MAENALNSSMEPTMSTGCIGGGKEKEEGEEELIKCIVIGGGGQSLQDSFKRFRVQKVKERKILQKCRDEISETGPRTEEYKNQLRAKFIEQAKKYIGVPYAERFKAPDAPIAPLYLDCCALVRKCVQDLQEEFGFVIGKWNQCYQMDTLPVVLEQSQLRPGDLIFYEGIYNSNKSKPQKHNNVHVEIYLGGETGEATIGSRYHKGNVGIFPSFKFKSTTWDLVQYHFRSLDPWLEGSCRSCCSEHPWLSDTLAIAAAAGKRSIFNDMSDDEGAGGEDEEEEEAGGGSSDDLPEEGEGQPVSAPPAPAPEDVSGDTTKEPLQPRTDYAASDSESTAAAETAATVASGSSKEEGQPTQPAMKALQPTQSPTKSTTPQRSTPTSLKVQGVSAARSTAMPAPLAPRLRRSTDTSTSSAATSTATAATSSSPARKTTSSRHTLSRVSSSLESLDSAKGDSTSPPHTYYVGNTNGWKLVKTALDKRGWQQLPFEYQFSSRFGLKWVERRSQIDYRSHVPGQLVCHIPNNEVITTKVGLLMALRDTFCKGPAGGPRKKTPWLPETYTLESPTDINALMQANQALSEKATDGRDPIWIYKPSCNNRGRGIRVVSGVEMLKEICFGKDTGSPESSIPKSQGIVQKYIEAPLLVRREGESVGYKFDYRCYMLVARNQPSYLVFFHPGYCRLTLKPYSDSPESLADSTIHLTNAAVQKKDPLYETNKDFQIQSVESVAKLVELAGDATGAAYLRNELDVQVKRCMVDILRSSTPKFLRKHGFFDMFGLDFMVTLDRQLLLLEVNTNPALSLDNAVLEELLPQVVDGALEIVLKAQGPDRAATETDAALLASVPGQWQLLLDEEGKFEFTPN